MLNILDIRFEGRVPRVHPNGFIQLDLNEENTQRLHVWTPKPLNKQKTDHQIHDHRFDMYSQVITGTLHNYVYGFEQDAAGGYERYHAVYTTRHEATLQATGERGTVIFKKMQVVRAGESYSLPKLVLHASRPSPNTPYVATIMESSNGDRSLPVSVMVPIGVDPDNEFDRHSMNDELMLWDEIRVALSLQGKEQVWRK